MFQFLCPPKMYASQFVSLSPSRSPTPFSSPSLFINSKIRHRSSACLFMNLIIENNRKNYRIFFIWYHAIVVLEQKTAAGEHRKNIWEICIFLFDTRVIYEFNDYSLFILEFRVERHTNTSL